MRVLVTGGSGFIGSHVVDKLKLQGIDVRIFDMVMPTFRNDVEYYQGSLLDFDALHMAMNDIDVVYHLAAIADVKDVYENPLHSEKINTEGTANVLEAIRQSNSTNRIIYASTIWVYSDCVWKRVDETTPLTSPSHLYTSTKLASEYYCNSYSKLYGVDYTILRYGIPYGPRARSGAVIPIFVEKALKNEPITISGDGSQYRKFVYVEDLAEGNVLALKDIAKNKIYNLEGKEKITIRQIAEAIQGIIKNVEIEYISARLADFSGTEILAEKAREELNWIPNTTFNDGLRKYIEWFKKNKFEKSKIRF